MKKLVLFMVVAVLLFTLVACGQSPVKDDDLAVNTEGNVENSEEETEEQMRIDENNAVIQPKLDALEATIVEIETVVADNNLDQKYQSVIDQLREELDEVTKNHQAIIDMGGYLEGTSDFEAAVDKEIENNKEILVLIVDEIALSVKENKFVDRFNELVDLTNEVTAKAQENGWNENEALLSDLSVVYGFLDEVGAKLASSDIIEDTYKNEKLEKMDELFPLLQNQLETVSTPFTE
ncbi:MAG: lipoprotein [Velocimicrobium sp.]